MVHQPDAAILAAARAAFERYGYAGTTLERIAEQVGVSRVTLHRRGVTRDGLLAELVVRSTAHYRTAMWPALIADGTGAERLELALEALCTQAEEQMGLLVALRAQSDAIFHRPDTAGVDDQLTRSVYTDPLERLLRDGAADGSLQVDDALETATVLFNLVGWTYVHLRTGHGFAADRARRAVLTPVLHGLLTPTTEVTEP